MSKKSDRQSGLPRRSSTNRRAEAGEIATIIALGSMAFILVTTLITSTLSNKPQTTSTQAAITCNKTSCTLCGAGYWCNQSCSRSGTNVVACVKNATSTPKPGSGGGANSAPSKTPIPPASGCKGVGSSCQSDAQCCSNNCSGAKCGASVGEQRSNKTPTPTKGGNIDQPNIINSPTPTYSASSSSGSKSSPTPTGSSGSSSSCNCPPAGGAKYGWLSFGKCICTNCFCRGSGGSAYCASNSGNNQYEYVDPSNCCNTGTYSSACENLTKAPVTPMQNLCSGNSYCSDNCGNNTPVGGDAQRYCSVNNKGTQCCKKSAVNPTQSQSTSSCTFMTAQCQNIQASFSYFKSTSSTCGSKCYGESSSSCTSQTWQDIVNKKCSGTLVLTPPSQPPATPISRDCSTLGGHCGTCNLSTEEMAQGASGCAFLEHCCISKTKTQIEKGCATGGAICNRECPAPYASACSYTEIPGDSCYKQFPLVGWAFGSCWQKLSGVNVTAEPTQTSSAVPPSTITQVPTSQGVVANTFTSTTQTITADNGLIGTFFNYNGQNYFLQTL